MLKTISISLIICYQRYLRYALPCSCRFSPSCSEYAKQAISKYGMLKGGLLAAKRVLNCHPFSRAATHDPLV